MVDIVQVASPLSLSLSANNTVEDPLYRNARVTVSVDTLHPQGKISNGFSNARVYRGAAQLFDPGLYTIDARLEARGAQWNAEPGQMTPAYEETQIQFAGNHLGVRRDTRHPTYIARHQRLPLCTQGDAPGRWIPKENLPGHWQSWQHLYPAEDGRVWMPYHCRLRLISHAEFTFHMSYMYPSVHWYGDSNSRRTLRPIVSAGKWCYRKDEQSRLDCLCNDAPKDLFPDEWYKQMPVPHWYRVHTSGVLGEEIYADLRNRTRAPTDPRAIVAKDPSDLRYSPDYVPPGYRLRDDYFDLYYLFTRGTQDMYGSYWQRDITENGIKTYPRARLVVFQMITWDVAFGSFADFVEQTALLVRRLKAVYPGAQFVYRSGPYWCCRAAEDQGKKYSRMRFLAFDRHARGVFKKHLDAWIWDVMGPAASRCPESKRMEDNMPCRSAHSRSEVIHIDNQMLMNMVVNNIRDE
ncbi:hypothetical protein GGI07_005095 [Coemansia sp. Benny D115]|nr:hypothetical protein GGI07_005095 [Coemansia sp. Benny D115]